MNAIILCTTNLIISVGILAIISKVRYNKIIDEPFIDNHNWSLIDAYKVAIPVIILSWLMLAISNLCQKQYLAVPLISIMLWCISICLGYFYFIKRPYLVRMSVFGLDKSHFLRIGVLYINIVLIIIVILINTEAHHKTIHQNNIRLSTDVILFSLTMLIVLFISPVLEELLFRGILYAPTVKKIGTWKSIILLSLVETLIHPYHNMLKFMICLLFWIILYYCYDKYHSLYVTIVLHIGLNLYNAHIDINNVLITIIDINIIDSYITYGALFILSIIDIIWSYNYINRININELHNN